ncbi:Reticulocyte-binding protein 2 homolog a, partial [Geodia barretti]
PYTKQPSTHESQCPEREVNCKYCELEVRAGDYDSHIETCGSRTDFCDRCNVRVMLKDMEEHKLAKCSDLKVGDGLHLEPTLENLPSAYMDGFAGDGFSAGASSQGVLMGDGAEGAFGGIRILGGFGMAPQQWSREENLELDQEWLQEVGGVCEGEDLDRMMAQAIAMETNQQATSNDHLFGIDDRFRREDHYANVVRDMEDEREANDEEMARRLQNTFDHEYNLERTDENLARQLRREEETVGVPDSPPLTSVLSAGTNTPISAHHPQEPLTSHLPTVDYQTSMQRTRFSVPGGREGDNDNNDEEEWRRERERLREEEREKEREQEREKEREKEREQLRERLREEEREGEQLKERLRKEEREREHLLRRLREQVREGQGHSEERKLLTGRLDMEERGRMASKVERDMWRVRQNGDEAMGAEYDHGEDAPEKIGDAELAYKLQKKEIEDARIAAMKKNEEMLAEIERKQMEMKSTELIIRMSKEDMEYNMKKLAEHKAKIDSLTQQIQELSEKKVRGRYWSETGATPGKWDADFYPRHEYDESHFDEPPPTPPNSPPASPSPPQSPVPTSSSAADYVRLERNDDEDEPRPKPIPKSHPQDREKIPCQFCQKSFPLDVIMSHQVM